MMTDSSTPADETEAYRALAARVGRKTGKIPADRLIPHILENVPAREWPTRVEAMDALLRRLDASRKDELRVDQRPPGGQVLGLYATRRKGSAARPYRTLLASIDPIEASCDCPDFLKNSLGICKHVFAILDHLQAKPTLLAKGLKEREDLDSSIPDGPRWDPIRPLTGAGDWLDRVSLASKPSGAMAGASRWFGPGKNQELILRNSYPSDPAKRLLVVEDLARLIPVGPSHDPALRALVVGERERLKARIAGVLTLAERRKALKGLKRSLYPYQKEGVERFLAAGRLLLADDMGLGKTAQAIASCEALLRSGRVSRGLIIAPASLKPQWAREWASFSELPIEVVDGTPDERRELYRIRKNGFFIINYEQLIRDLDAIRKWAPGLVVLDEAQRIKNWATKTALSVKGLSPPFRLVLTGTPMENRIEELASVVEWVDDMALEPKWRLGPLHSIHADGKKGVIGVRNLDTIRDRLKGCMVRRVRQDVLDQLPPRTDTRVPVNLTEEQKSEHDELIQPIAQLIQKARARPLSQPEFLRLMSFLTMQRIISNGLAQRRFDEVWPAIKGRKPDDETIQGLFSPKLLELRQLIRQVVLDQGRKVVVFSQWRRMLTLASWSVGDLLAENGLRAGFFTGAEGQKRRTQNIVEFHDDPDYRLLFASDAGGVGLNLQHAANCVINLELPWNPAVLEQRIGRIYRLGQSKPIDVYNLVAEQGIESRIAGLVGSKQAFFKGLFDGDSDSVQFDHSGSFLSRVEKIYEPVASTIASDSEPVDLDLDLDLDATPDDDVVSGPFEPILDAADESLDPAEAAAELAGPRPKSNPNPKPKLLDDPTVSPSSNGASDGPATTTTTTAEVRRLFSQLDIRRKPDGRVVIEAPAEAASALGALFEGMAGLLKNLSEKTE